jgi:hypothetical protein
MKMRSRIVLSVAAGRSSTGYAVFCGRHLEYYGIVSLGRYINICCLLEAISRFLARIGRRFPVDELALRRLTPSQKPSKFLPAIQRHLILSARRSGWTVHESNGATANAFIADDSAKPTNHATEVFLTQEFPELAKFTDPRIPSRQFYYRNLFKAVAVGYMRLNKENKGVTPREKYRPIKSEKN